MSGSIFKTVYQAQALNLDHRTVGWGDEGTPTKCLSFENVGVHPSPQPTALGHFYTSYDNISDLKLKFNDQLVKLRRKEF